MSARHTTWQRCFRRGSFTLLELIVVMVVLATLMGLVATSLRGFVHGRYLREETLRFVAATRYAASEAISRGETATLILDPDASLYFIEFENRGCPRVDHEVEFTVQRGVTLDVGEADQTEDGEYAIVFHPDGQISENTLQEVAFRNSDNQDELLVAVLNSTKSRYVIEGTEDELPAEEEEE